MLHFIPAWYQQNNWCENEQNWYSRRMRTEFDDTVKQIQLFHRSQAYPFQVMLLSFAPNYRHFLHRQSVFHAPYWSVFDAIQEIHKKKVRIFSFHNLQWPEHVEFIYSPFVVVAMLNGERYAQVEFGEDGNMIQIDMYQKDVIQRRNIYDDRGFISSTIVYENGMPVRQDYLNEKGVWKLRHHLIEQRIDINPKLSNFLIEYEGKEYKKKFSKMSYDTIEEIIYEVLSAYLEHLDDSHMFCIAAHQTHMNVLENALKGRKVILSFFENRYNVEKQKSNLITSANYIITDSQENLKKLRKGLDKEMENVMAITPFDSRVDFGISQQLNVQKILVPVDGISDTKFRELIISLGEYLPKNENARIHLFTRMADYDRKKVLLEQVREILQEAGMEPGWAAEEKKAQVVENRLDAEDTAPILFRVEQCVDELSVSKCMREQRLIVDMRSTAELYLRITAISIGIPQIVAKSNQFVEHEKNGLVVKSMDRLSDALSFYLESLTNWNEAMVYSYELGKKYTTRELIEKWKEVISFVGSDSSITVGEQ